MTSLAWNLKAWLALWPTTTGPDPGQATQQTEQQRVLRMEFKTFVNHLMRLPAMVVRTGRRVIVRFLSWTPLQPLLFRVLENRPAALASHDAERIDRAERRHLQAIKMLATVRKMGVAIQVNVATQV